MAPQPAQVHVGELQGADLACFEQMGEVLRNTSYSVNIKERLDFSCAIFDGAGDLVANAPHIPVHLGSMSESVKSIVRQRTGTINFSLPARFYHCGAVLFKHQSRPEKLKSGCELASFKEWLLSPFPTKT